MTTDPAPPAAGWHVHRYGPWSDPKPGVPGAQHNAAWLLQERRCIRCNKAQRRRLA